MRSAKRRWTLVPSPIALCAPGNKWRLLKSIFWPASLRGSCISCRAALVTGWKSCNLSLTRNDFAEHLGQVSGRQLRLALQAQDCRDSPWRAEQGQRQLAVIQLLLGGHEDIEIQRQVFMRGV